MGNNMDANKNGFTLNLQIQKLVVWIVLISILYLVRPLFPVMFLTFILSYIGNTAVKFLHKRIPYRRVCLSAVYLVFILALIGIIYAVLPKIYDEASQLAKQHLHKDEIIRVVTTETASEKATIELAEARIGLDHEMGVAEHDTKTVTAGQTLVGDEIRKLLDRFGGRVMGKQGYETFKTSGAYTEVIIGGEHAVMEFVPKIVDKVSGLVNNIVTLVFHFFLAMIF
ncbi:MAG: AI-2E family transporter [Candidatus Lindowbacteria bacterium]|nr:AI-2E family transporter [Candidatus Lindowbacteria bacterium]